MSPPAARLLTVTAGLAGLEAALLQWIHFVSAVPLAPQVSAPAPFGTFHDLRWVWTFNSSWLSFVWMLIALFVFRTVTNATIIRFAWPAELSPPPYLTLLRRSALFTVLAIVAMSPWATLTFMTGAVGFSPLMLAAIIGSGLTALVLPPAIITGEWWRRVLPIRSMGWTLISWVELMVAALAITFSPGWVAVLVALGGGAFNAWTWRRIVSTVLKAGRPRWTIPALPVVAVAISALLLAAGGYIFTATFAEGGGSIQRISEPAAAGAQPVVFVAGFGTSYDGGPFQRFPSGFATVRYSYRGTDGAGNPLPYGTKDTYQSLQVSSQRLAALVQAVHQKTGQPVSVVAESEGTMVARAYFAATSDPPVNTYIQLSPLIRPARVYYPESGQDGFGYVSGWEARGILALFRLESPSFQVNADIPFIRSLVTAAPLYRDQTMCPIPGVRTFMFLPLEGALTVYRGPLSRIDWTALPAYHASLLNSTDVQREVTAVLSGEDRHLAGWNAAFQIMRGAAGAWQSPALPLRSRPAWQAQPNSDPAFGQWNCPSVPPG